MSLYLIQYGETSLGLCLSPSVNVTMSTNVAFCAEGDKYEPGLNNNFLFTILQLHH